MKQLVDGTTEYGKAYPIQPEHINVTMHFTGAFNDIDTEVSARTIVMLCQQAGGWMPFTKEEIDAFTDRNFSFRLLRKGIENAPIMKFQGGKIFYITHDFIVRCFRSAPLITT